MHSQWGQIKHFTSAICPLTSAIGSTTDLDNNPASCAFQVFQHFFRMAVGLHVVEDVLDFAVRANHEGGSRDDMTFLPYIFFSLTTPN